LFINIDYNKKPQKAKIELAKPNKKIRSNIHESFNAGLNIKLGKINELTFSIPHYLWENDQKVYNKHVDEIKERMLLRVKYGAYIEWFLVDSIEEDGDDEDTFNVTAQSLAYELRGSDSSGIEEEAINATGLLNLILKDTAWKIGTIDPIFDAMFRSFETGDDENALDSITTAGETFGALIIWNTETREVSFKDFATYGRFRGMTVNYGKYLKSIKRSRTQDELTTILHVYGSEGLSIHSHNPTGQAYIEDYSYFMHPFERNAQRQVLKESDYMSDELCHALLDHKAALQQSAPQIKQLGDSLAEKRSALIIKESELSSLNGDLDLILALLDIAQSAEDETAIVLRKAERDEKQSEVAGKEIEINVLKTQLNSIQNELDALHDQLSNDSNFTSALLEELKFYQIKKTWRDDNYIDSKELYEDGLKKFKEYQTPKVVIEVTMSSLLEIVEEQYYWDKLILGDEIKVKYPQMNIEYMAKIIEIDYDLENGEANLVIANTNDLLNDNEKLAQLIYDSASATTLVENNKYKWKKINAISETINNILLGEWDATKNKIIAGVNNSVEVGNRGIIIKNPDFPSEVIIIQSGVIALSKDGGETWKTAINPSGIVAENLIGQIIAGQELLITNSSGSFTLDDNGAIFDVNSFKIRSGSSGGNLVDRWQTFSDFVDEYRDDNLITPFEKKMLNIKWEEIAKRYTVMASKINNYYDDAGVSLNFVNNFHYRYDELYAYLYVRPFGDFPMLAPLNLAYTTRVVSSEFNSKFRDYDSALVESEKQLDIKAKELSDKAIQDSKNAQDNIEEIMNDVVYKIEIHSSNGFIFRNGQINTTLTVTVYRGKDDITSTIPINGFVWRKADKDGANDTAWNTAHINVGRQIIIDRNDVYQRATFQCSIDI